MWLHLNTKTLLNQSLTCMLFMVSRSCSSWCAELSASSRMSVSFISFSHSSDRSSDTIFSSPSFSSLLSWILLELQCHYCLKIANTWKQSKGYKSPITVAFQKWNCPLLPDFRLILWLAQEDFTHTEEVADWLDWREVGVFSPSSWPSFGELGADESGVAISSISEYMEPPLAPFLMLNALPKEFRNYREIERKAENLKHTNNNSQI